MKKILILIALLLLPSSAFAAVRASIATGNFTAAATWGTVDATMYATSESSTVVCPTSYSNVCRSAQFTPGAITVSHIGVKLSVRTGTTGTMTVHIANSSHVEVASTAVTINTADLPVAATADINGGWHFFKLGSPVTLSAATLYETEAQTSSASQISLFASAATSGMSVALITTATGAPAAGDDLIVAGEYTGTGTSNSFTVTMNQTATTDYGAGSALQTVPALGISNKGTLTWGTAASTNYNLKISGNLIIYSGGTMNVGTVATAIPRNSSATITFDCVGNIDFGLTVRNLGTLVMQGLSRTSGKNIDRAKLNTDEAAAQTVLGVDTDTGWLNGDDIVIASTSRTASETENRTLSANANASDITVSAGLTNAHSGTSPTQAEIILLTRNVKMFGASTTAQTYLDIKATATVDVDWVEFKWMGSNNANRRGIDIATTTGSASFTYCAFRNWVVSSSRIVVSGSTSDNYTFQNIVTSDVSLNFNNVVTTGTAWIVDNWIATLQTAGTQVLFFADVGGTITNITVAGCATTGSGIVISESGANIGTIGSLTTHSNGGPGINLANFYNGTITGTTTSWRNSGVGMIVSKLGDVIFSGGSFFGNTGSNIQVQVAIENVYFNNFILSGDSTFSTTTGVTGNSNSGGTIYFNDSTFGVASGIKTAHTQDLIGAVVEFVNIKMNNCTLASSTEVASQTVMPPGQFFGSSKHDQTAGLHKAWKREGTITIDTTIYDTTPSVRITPTIANEKCEGPGFKSAVSSGNTLSVTVKVRESIAGDGTDYNGNRIRIILKQNSAAGITADTVMATATVASEGAFETLSFTTASVTDDAVLEFVPDTDGTTGWVNVDTWTVSSQASTLGAKYWKDGQAVAYGDNSAGGGGSSTDLLGVIQ